MMRSDDALDLFFSPRGVVLIGASRDQHKLGYGIARNLAGFAGAVHFVNPNATDPLLGRSVYSSLSDVPDPVDLAVLLVPAGLVPDLLAACGRRGIKAAIIVSGGFREAGPVGADLEAQCVSIAADHGMRLIGPNCIGIIDTHLGFNTTFLAPPGPEIGDLAFVSHSGAMCAAVIDWSAGRGFGLSRLVSLGNQADIDEVEGLAMVAEDPKTQVIMMYLESVTEGERFVELAGRMTKPVVALKVGRREGGRKAVVSHTGALAGREEAYRAAFRRAGVIRVPTIEAMFDAARVLAWAPLPSGRRTAVLTNAGGPGVTTADAIETDGLLLAELSDATRQGLADSLPAGAGLLNPVDMLASAAPQEFGRSLQILLAAPEVDGVVVVIAPPPMVSSVQVVDAMVDVIGPSPKPVMVAVLGDRTVGPAVDRLREARIPEFRFPERATAAMAVLTDRAERLASPAGSPPVPTGVDRDRAARLLAGASSGWLGPAQGADLVAAYGIAVASGLAATTSNEAVEALVALGGPVALKIDHPGVVHKADRGGVRLGVSSPDEVREAFVDLAHLAGIADGSDAGQGRVYVQRMVETGQDVIIGAVRDSQFGPLVMFGSGGAEVEGLEDVEFALAPLTRADVDHLLAQTWAGRRLSGYRTIPPGDVTAVEGALFRIGRLISDHSNIEEIEINPLRVQSPGAGALALDVRVRVG